MIKPENLSRLSNRIHREEGGLRIPDEILERDYCLSWFLVGLTNCPLNDNLIFKGGTAIKKCYIAQYRFSVDLDFSLRSEMPFDYIEDNLPAAFLHVERSTGMKLGFSRRDRHSHTNSHTFYLKYTGPIRRVYEKEVKVDITIRENFVCPIEERPILIEYPEYEDLPEDAIIHVYSLNEIAVEKTVALLDRARNEPRDLYDFWYLTSQIELVMVNELIEEIKEKLGSRGKTLSDTSGEFLRKESYLKARWQGSLSNQLSVLPEFDEVYRAVKRKLRQSGLL